MPALLRQLSLIGLLAFTLCATAATGYLPKVGPPPVRFEPPAPLREEPRVVLPPLAVLEPLRPPPVEIAKAATPPKESVPAEPALPIGETTVAVPVVVPAMPMLVIDPGTTNAAPDDHGVLAPQMFMKYFTGQPGTNGNGISFFAPVEFVPPVPVAPVSSTATFETTPPGKP
jgi:hypothetical protein